MSKSLKDVLGGPTEVIKKLKDENKRMRKLLDAVNQLEDDCSIDEMDRVFIAVEDFLKELD